MAKIDAKDYSKPFSTLPEVPTLSPALTVCATRLTYVPMEWVTEGKRRALAITCT
jgi:hypothetical protein